jgi:hypothetical protein
MGLVVALQMRQVAAIKRHEDIVVVQPPRRKTFTDKI